MEWIFIAAYLLSMAVIGLRGRKKTSDLTTFVVGGRKAGPWVSALAYGATYFSAVLFIGYAGRSGWDYGLWAVLIGVGNGILGAYLSWKLLAPKTREVTRRLKIKSMPQMFEKRYASEKMKLFSAAVIFVFMIPYSASVYSGLSYLCEAVLNIDYDLAMFLIAAVAAVYLVLGGYLASLAADFVQGLLIIGGVVFMIVFVMNSPTVGGFTHGISTVLDKMDAAGILRLDGNGIIGLISLILLTSIGTWGMPQMIHKFYGIENEEGVRRGRVISTAFCIFVSAGAYFIGGISRLFYDEVPTLNGLQNYDLIVPGILQTLPSVLLGIIMVLVLSASVSTLSGITLTSCSTMTMDIFPKIMGKRYDKKRAFFSTRLLCLLFIVFSYIIALCKSPILMLMSFSWGTIAGSFLSPYLLGLLWKRMNRKGAWAGMLSGFFTSIILTAASGFNSGQAAMFGVIAMVVSFAVCIVASLCTSNEDAAYTAAKETYFDTQGTVR